MRRRPLVVVAVTLAALLGAGAWLLIRSQRYVATSQVLVSPAPYYDPTYLGLPGVVRDTPGDPFRAVETAATMFDSPSAAASSAQRLGTGWSPARVQSAVTVVPMGGTNVLAVQASADQGRLASHVADTFAEQGLADRLRVLRAQALGLIAQLRETPDLPVARLASLRAVSAGNDPTFSLLHLASGPGLAAGPDVRQMLTVVLFAGLVLGIGVALLVDLVERPGARRAGPADSSDVPGLPTANGPLAREHERRGDTSTP